MNVARRFRFEFRYLRVFLVVFSLILFSLFIFLFANSKPTKADTTKNSNSNVNLSINSALALSLTNCDSSGNLDTTINNQTINIDIIPTPVGLFKSNCQNIEVLTNTPGYTLTAKAEGTSPEYNSGTPTNTLLYQNPRDTVLIPTLPTIPSTTNTTTTPSTLTNNTWGFAVEARLNFDSTYTQNNQNNNYAELPTIDLTIYETDQFPLPITNHKFFYATKLDTSLLAGTYSTTITYTAVGVDIPLPYYTESYTTGSAYLFVTSDTPIAYGSKIMVGGQECTDIAYTSLMSAVCRTPANSKGLKKITIVPPPASQGTMQNWNQCSTLSIGDIIILTDSRNNQDYRIRKMEDGKCWMIDNLKIAGTTLTPTDSNISSSYNLVAVSSFHSTDNSIPYIDDPSLNSETKSNCLYNMGTSPDSLTGCGYLYSWPAATANTGDDLSTGSQNAPGSICPIGWRLPTGGTIDVNNSDSGILNGAMSGESNNANTDNSRSKWWSTGLFSGSYAGSFRGDIWANPGYNSRWWTSTSSTSNAAFNIYVSYDSLYPGINSNDRHYGASVRCIGGS